MRRAWVVFLAALAACGGTGSVEPQVSAVLDETFQLRVGQQVRIGAEPLVLRFEAVPEDSRCPVDVVCVWQGNAKVRLRVSPPVNGGDVVDLNTSLANPTALIHGYELRLERLEPQPNSKSTIPRDRYVAHLTLTRP